MSITDPTGKPVQSSELETKLLEQLRAACSSESKGKLIECKEAIEVLELWVSEEVSDIEVAVFLLNEITNSLKMFLAMAQGVRR
jgi:hypothetical protein